MPQTANVVANYQKILLLIKSKRYISEIAIADKSKENYLYVREVLDELLKDGLIKEVGNDFSSKYNKLFKLYASCEGEIDNLPVFIANKQYKAQRKAFVKSQCDIIREAGNDGAVKSALEFFTKQNARVELKYHALKRADIIELYKLVITHGTRAINNI